jgi:diguanylate cyclase (GGDEF)-like protein
MENELPFEGFEELIKKSLEQNDPESYKQITRFLLDIPVNPKAAHYSLLIRHLTGKTFENREAQKHWRLILKHKLDMEAKLGRLVRIQPSAIDYFDVIGKDHEYLKFTSTSQGAIDPYNISPSQEEWVSRIYAPGYHFEKMKEELLRAKRYRHALSAILLDVDNFRQVNEKYSFKAGDEVLTLIVKIIRKIIRTVDIITRYSGDRFLIILPNTNKREAVELADRLRVSINERTRRISGLAEHNGVTVTISVCQCDHTKQTPELLKQLEHLLNSGKQKQRNAVYAA